MNLAGVGSDTAVLPDWDTQSAETLLCVKFLSMADVFFRLPFAKVEVFWGNGENIQWGQGNLGKWVKCFELCDSLEDNLKQKNILDQFSMLDQLIL